LLQGHGPDLPALFQTRAKSWAQAVANEVHQARSEGLPVMLLGFSLGGGLAVTAASLSNPDKLVLLAPLYWEETWPVTLAGNALSVFLPHTFAPFGSRFIPLETFREPIRQISPDVQFDDPQVQASIRRQRLPMLLFEQVNLAVRLARDSAASIRMPVLVIQGKQDPIIRPERTQQLVKRLGPNVDYVEIPGEHQIVQPDGPGFAELVERVERFLAQ
ncbi:MAG: alpha/beta fold hydrolase, partial [Anaerolineae bacterium]|nr:alpha/beta fold hydrolase [Anaerolineae bacterium]